ncbi:MAG: QueT transporter family protein [Clostridiales bacterium]|nr:QueT transporter family protein [Clostridiales bacterium]
MSIKKIVRAGVVGALYIALSMMTFSFSSTGVQFRPSEALCVLPLIFPETAAGLFVGCLFTNLITGCVVWDTILGSLITLVAGVMTAVIGRLITQRIVKVIVGGVFPVILNALFLPLIWLYFCGGIEYLYILQCLILFVSQTLSVYALGIPLYLSIESLKDKGLKII